MWSDQNDAWLAGCRGVGFSTSPSDSGTGRARVSSGVSARAGSSVLALPWAMTGVGTNRAAFTGEPRKLGGVFRSGVPSPASDEWSCHCTLRRDGEPEVLSTESLSLPTLWEMLDATLEREDARWRAFVMRWRSVEAVAGDSAPRLSRWVGDPACDENAELGRLHDSRHTRVTAHPHPHPHTHAPTLCHTVGTQTGTRLGIVPACRIPERHPTTPALWYGRA